tara:strand:- start:17873 stop:18463 length:591 start_codon:yes stop_codon:yes gene_type:complete
MNLPTPRVQTPRVQTPSRTLKLKCVSVHPQVYNKKRVGILMGSSNDYSKMKDAVTTLQSFEIQTDVRILSAHRQPYEVVKFASRAKDEGYLGIICGAGMAAHLAGVVASHTTLPVIGVPLSGGALHGIDALYSTVQMPKGIPVATVAIDNSTNAAILMAQMIAITDKNMDEKINNARQENRTYLNSLDVSPFTDVR